MEKVLSFAREELRRYEELAKTPPPSSRGGVDLPSAMAVAVKEVIQALENPALGVLEVRKLLAEYEKMEELMKSQGFFDAALVAGAMGTAVRKILEQTEAA